jgi:hypothetical protein
VAVLEEPEETPKATSSTSPGTPSRLSLTRLSNRSASGSEAFKSTLALALALAPLAPKASLCDRLLYIFCKWAIRLKMGIVAAGKRQQGGACRNNSLEIAEMLLLRNFFLQIPNIKKVCMKDVVMAIAGQSVSEQNADKDVALIMYNEARKYVHQGRFLIDFREEIVLRGQHFQPFFTFDVISINAVQPTLEATFHDNPTPQEVKWAKTCFDQVKTACWNLWNPEYDKTSKKQEAGGDSGTYDDQDLIMKFIKDAIESRVEDNFKKFISNGIVTFKKADPTAEDRAIRDEEKRLCDLKKDYYAATRTEEYCFSTQP